MAISWPGHIKDVGGIRSQFHHMIDIMPTILEATGIPAPATVNGITQKPIEGVSMAYTFDQANAKAPSTRKTQYFEMAANRGIYNEGWMANTTPFAPPWDLATGKLPDVVSGYKWELYNLTEDFSQNNDLAAKNPDKLKEMQALFLKEAAKYNVLPLDNTAFSRLLTARPSATAGQTVFTYTGENSGIPLANAPSILDKDYTITAEVTIPEGRAEGMIVTLGGRMGGYALFLSHSFNWWLKSELFKAVGLGMFVFGLLLVWVSKKSGWSRWLVRAGHAMVLFSALWVAAIFATGLFGIGRGRPVFVYNLLDLERFRWEGLSSLSAGKHTLVFDFKYDGPGPGKGGTGVFSVDGKEVAKKSLEHTIPLMMAIDETFDVGVDTRTPVDFGYDVPFRFTGTIDKLTYKLGPTQLSSEEQNVMERALARAKD
jgi:arylsulfatase